MSGRPSGYKPDQHIHDWYAPSDPFVSGILYCQTCDEVKKVEDVQTEKSFSEKFGRNLPADFLASHH